MSSYLNLFKNNSLTIEEIINLYELKKSIFPSPLRNGGLNKANSINEISDKFDAFIFDSFGVLNIGGDLISHVPNVLNELKRKGKIITVLTNGASYPTSKKVKTFNKWKLPFNSKEVISSRDLLKKYLKNEKNIIWGVIGSPGSDLDELGVEGYILGKDMDNINRCEGIIYLGCEFWSEKNQKILENYIDDKHMKILVGNPDIIAPQQTSFSIEPGFWSLNFHKSKKFKPIYFGKPHSQIYELAISQINKIQNKSIELERIAMVGDSLHTDILGGLASKISTILVTNHGLFKNHDYLKEINKTNIFPDWIVPSI